MHVGVWRLTTAPAMTQLVCSPLGIRTEFCRDLQGSGLSEDDDTDAQRGLAAPEWQSDSIEAEQLSPVQGSGKVPIQCAPIGIEAALEGCAILPSRPIECLQ